MGSFNFTAEAGTEGQVATTANFTAVSGTTTYRAAAAHMGNFGYRMQPAGTPIVYCLANSLATGTGTQAERFRFYVRMSAYPTSGNAMIFQTQVPNGTELVSIRVDPSGHLLVYDGGTLTFTSTFVVPLNTWVRCELVFSEGSTGVTGSGIIGFGAVVGSAALTTTNSSSQAYYYKTNATYGTTAGLGNFLFGKIESTSNWTCTLDWDDLAGDNSTNAAKTWTSNPSTWLGPGASSFAAILAATATAGFTVAGRNDLAPSVFSASAAGSFATSGQRVQLSTLPASAAASLVVSGATDRIAALALAAPSSSLVLASFKDLSAVLAAVAAGGLVVGPVRTQFGAVSMVAGSPAMAVGTLRTQFSVVPMNGLAVFSPIPNPGQSSPLTLAAVAGLVVTGSKALSAGLALAGAGQMALTGSKALSTVLAARGTPALAVGVLLSRSILWAARGTPVLTLGPLRTALAVWSVRGTAAFDIPGRVFGDIHPYDNVIALLIEAGALAQILPHRKAAQLLDNGKSIADVLGNSTAALLLPGGMLAVIQD